MERFFDAMRDDLRLALRAHRSAPVFCLVAVLSLALGIGANATIFSLINSVLLKSLPVAEPESLAVLTAGRNDSWTNLIWEQIRDGSHALAGVFAWGTERFDLSDGGETRFAEGIYTSGGYFDQLLLRPGIGRFYTAEDDRRGCGADEVPAVLSYGFWQSRYGGDPAVLGRIIRLDGHPFTISGVAPASFYGLDVGRNFDVAVPICSEAALRGPESSLDRRSHWWLRIAGRLAPGSSIEEAQASLRAIQPAVREATLPTDWPAEYLDSYLKQPFTLLPAGTGVSTIRTRYRRSLYVLMVVVALVLVAACANIAGLLLARASVRRREIAVCVALGAPRRRLVRRLLVESLLLGVAGAAAGILISQWTSRLFVSQLTTGRARAFLDLGPDWRVLGFTAAVGVATGVLFGILPALGGTSVAPNEILRSGARGSTGAEGRRGMGRWLVAAQIALSMVLLFGAAMFVRSYSILTSLDPGFHRDNVLIATVDLTRSDAAQTGRLQLYNRIHEAVRALPGVRSAAFSTVTPISGSTWMTSIRVDGYRGEDSGAYYNYVSPGYFETLGTALLAGRDFDSADKGGSRQVAIVNEALAKKFFGGRNPIGAVYRTRGGGAEWRTIEIVGVVRDAKYRNLRDPAPPTAYEPITQIGEMRPSMVFSFYGSVPASALRPAVIAAVGGIDKNVALTFRTLQSQIDDSLIQERLLAMLSALFGLLALTVAAVGLAGLVAWSVSRRRAEIGVRAALGATPASLVRLVLAEVGWLTLIGLAAGSAAGVAAGRFASALLYGLESADPIALASAAVLLALVSAVAAYIPARRAARIDPIECLRAE